MKTNDKDIYDQKGFNKDGLDKNGYKKNCTLFSIFKKYDINGYDKNGYDRGGYDKTGYNRKGLNKDGFDKEGYNIFGFNIEGYNKEGYNALGFNIEGYNKEGYNKQGFNRKGYNKAGYDEDGYNKEGFSSNGNPWWSSRVTHKKAQAFGSKKAKYNAKNIESSTIFNNPFYILGLNIYASNKEISKRSSDLMKLAEIGHDLVFPGDLFPIYRGAREAKRIKDATLSLSSESLKVIHSFLWVDICNTEHLGYIKDRKPYLVLYGLLSGKTQTNSEKHTLGVYSLITGIALGNEHLIKYSIGLLADVLIKTEYLSEFKIKYQEMSELKLSDQVFLNMKDKIIQILANTYFEASSKKKKWEIYHAYYDSFRVHSEKFISDLVLPTIEKLKNIRKHIIPKSMTYYSNKLSADSIKKINSWKRDFEKQLDTINMHKIQKETNIVSSIDDIAQSFSQLSIDILNTIDRDGDSQGYEYSKDLLDYSLKHASSVKIKDDINRNKKLISDLEKKNKLIEKAISDIKYQSSRGNSDEVIRLGKKLIEIANSSSEFEMIKKFIINQVIEALSTNLKSAMLSRKWSKATNIIDELLSFDELSYSDRITLRELRMKIMYRGFY